MSVAGQRVVVVQRCGAAVYRSGAPQRCGPAVWGSSGVQLLAAIVALERGTAAGGTAYWCNHEVEETVLHSGTVKIKGEAAQPNSVAQGYDKRLRGSGAV